MTDKPSFPVGLDAEVLVILKRRVGEKNAISRETLLHSIHLLPRFTKVSDSQMRLAIQALRSQRYLICSNEGGDGYYLASCQKEYDDFRARYGAAAFTVLANIREMDKTAAAEYDYNPDQMKLF